MLSRMRVGVPVLAALLLAGGWLLGQTKSTDEPPLKVKGTLPANFKKLGLSEEQTREIYKIRGTFATKIEALKQQIRDLHAEELAEIEKILTDGQKNRLRELKLGEPTKAKDQDKKSDSDKTGTDKTDKKSADKK
jgi:hypothetical protein